MENSRSKYHLYVLAAVALLTVVLFAHGDILIGGTEYFKGRRIPRSSSVEAVQFGAATQLASGESLVLQGDLALFPETVTGKAGIVPACSPAYLSLLSIPAKLASAITPEPEEIRVSAQLDAEKAGWERNYINYIQRYKYTVIFFQGPFLVLLLLFFYSALRRFVAEPGLRLWLCLGLCFGTLAYPFALIINPIFPAAVMLLCGLHHIWNFTEKGDVIDGVAAGLFLGAAILVNHLAYVPAVVMLIALGIRVREPERLLPVIGGLVPGVALFAYSHFTVFGDPLPAIYHRGGGQSGIVIIWKYLVWSLAGLNGALWMVPATGLGLIYSFAARGQESGAMYLKRGIGIAACLLIVAVALEGVLTFAPLVDPSTGERFEDAFSAARAMSPQLEVDVAGFPLLVAFHTMVFGGEAFALIGPCLFLGLGGALASASVWRTLGGVFLRIGVVMGIVAAVNPVGCGIFPFAENIYLIGYELSYRFPREAIF